MGGVDVRPQPEARVGDGEAGGRRGLAEARERRGGRRAGLLLEAERRGRVRAAARLEPRRQERVVVVARDEDELPLGPERRAERGEDRDGRGERVAHRAVAELERVAEHDEAIRSAHGVAERRERARAAQGVAAARAPEVEVRDDEGPHYRVPTRLMPSSCRGPEGSRAGAFPRRGRRNRGGSDRTAAGGRGRQASAADIAWRIAFGSMKRTSSRMTSNSETSSTPWSRKRWTSAPTSSSGALAPLEMPTTRTPVEPGLVELVRVVDEVRGGPVLLGDLHEAHGVRGVLRADDEHEVALLGHLLDGRLAVRRGVADVVRAGPGDRGEALAQAVDDRARLVDGQRRLGDVGELLGVLDLERRRRRPPSRPGRCGPGPPPSCPRPPRGPRGR